MTYNVIRNSHFTDFIHADQLVCTCTFSINYTQHKRTYFHFGKQKQSVCCISITFLPYLYYYFAIIFYNNTTRNQLFVYFAWLKSGE